MIRGLYFANHGRVLPSSCPTQAKVLTREEGDRWAELLARSWGLWVAQQGDAECVWMMFTSPGDPESVLCLHSFNGVYFAGVSGTFVDNADEV